MRDLNEIELFVRVVQFGSFSRAARSLGLPVSTVSRKVSELEGRLGLTLMKRTTRKLSLSDYGVRLFERCAPHLQGIDEAEASLTTAKSQMEGVLRVTAPVALGRGEFIDFVSGFMSRHPGIRIDLAITNQFVDLVTGNVDVAIRFGDLDDSSAIARCLGLSHRMLVASADYLRRKGTPRSPQELANHDCVVFIGETGKNEWRLVNAGQRTLVRVSGPASANNFETVSELAMRGLGVAFLPQVYVASGVDSGAFKRVLPQWKSPAIPVHAVYLNRKFVPAKLQLFLSELARWRTSSWDARAPANAD